MNNILDDYEEEEDIDQTKLLSFVVDGQYFAFPVEEVIEILEMQEVTAVPEFPNYARGIIKVREKIIPVIDVRARFHKDQVELNSRNCIIVVKIFGHRIGFIVDTVREIVTTRMSEIAPPPQITSDKTTHYIIGVTTVDSKLIQILDSNKMFNDEEVENLISI